MSLFQGSITARTAGKVKAGEWVAPLWEGLTPSAATMNLVTGQPHAHASKAEADAYHNAFGPDNSYPRNPALWLNPYLRFLTGVVFVIDDCGTSYSPVAGQCWHGRYGGTAITRRHILYMGHATPHAQGTWLNGVTGPNPPTVLRFLAEDGTPVDRIQLEQTNRYPSNRIVDLDVAVIDEDLPQSIHSFAIPSPEHDTRVYDGASVSQEWLALLAALHRARLGHLVSDPFNPEELMPDPYGYPFRARKLAWGWRTFGGTRSPELYERFFYRVWEGDSGTPVFLVSEGNLLLQGTLGWVPIHAQSLNFRARNYPLWPDADGRNAEQYINFLIDDADDRAIARGRLAERTGYRVTVAPPPDPNY